jgi:hypothetical protein
MTGIIEKSALDGQMTYHAQLDKAMRAYIHAHTSEFVPEGVDAAEVEAEEAEEEQSRAATPGVGATADPATAAARERERARSHRSLQWAYDTLEGAMKVAKQSAEGALEILSDAWDGSSGATVLYFVIAALVVSNAWTLAMMGRREEAGRRKAVRQAEEREKWVQGIVQSLWEERAVMKGAPPYAPAPHTAVAKVGGEGWTGEVDELNRALDAIEARVLGLRKTIAENGQSARPTGDLEALD